MKKLLVGMATGAILTMLTVQAEAVPVFSTGAGNSVTVANYSATFNTIGTGSPLLNYTEDNLIVSVNTTAWSGFSPGPGFDANFHYGRGGNYSYVSISTADSQEISGLEFLLGSGFANGGGSGYLGWQVYNDATLVGSGNSDLMQAGTVVGWKDSDGFDELRVAFFNGSSDTFGAFQAIALDNLKVQTVSSPASPVPEPATMLLFGTGIAGLAAVARRKKNA